MQTHELLPLIYDNFDIFHTMCLSTSLLATYNSNEFDADAHKIINFIGRAFKLNQHLIDEFEICILGDMMNIGLVTDYQAISSTEFLTDKDKENIELYEIKGRILEEVAVSEIQSHNISDIRIVNQIRESMKYAYFHHPYSAKLRFWQLARYAKNGNTDLVRQMAVLYALGIGCEMDFKKAEKYFLKCFLWGDKISAVLLTELYAKAGQKDSEFYKIYFEPDPLFENDNKACVFHKLMKLLNTYVIYPAKDYLINNELAEVLISEDISYNDKVDLLINFNERTWRNIHLLTTGKKNNIGFRR